MGPSGYELASLIDLDRVQRLCDSLSEAFDVTLAVLDLSGNVLIATGWQDICTRFHRENAETLQGCLESDLRINRRLVEGLDACEHYAYRCSNGLWDVAFPLVVAGEHVANVYTGQFFFEDDRWTARRSPRGRGVWGSTRTRISRRSTGSRSSRTPACRRRSGSSPTSSACSARWG